jgi:hypothetical protein
MVSIAEWHGQNVFATRSVPTDRAPVLIYDEVNEASIWLYDAFGFTERLNVGNGQAQRTMLRSVSQSRL